MKSRYGNKPKHGFTLIELLVTVAIIAILAAIIFPVFSQAKVSAKHTVCMSNMRQIAMAFIMYAESYDDGYAPLWAAPDVMMGPLTLRKPLLGYDNSVPPQNPARNPINPGNLDSYVKNIEIYRCPFQQKSAQLIWGFNYFWATRGSTYYRINPLAQGKEFGPVGIKQALIPPMLQHVSVAPRAAQDEDPSNEVLFYHHSANTPDCFELQQTDFYDSVVQPESQNHLIYTAQAPFRYKVHRGDKRVLLARTGGNISSKHVTQIKRPEFSMQKTGMGYPDYN